MGDQEKAESKATITPTIPVLRYVEEIEKKLELRKIASPVRARPESVSRAHSHVRRSVSEKDHSNNSNNNNNSNNHGNINDNTSNNTNNNNNNNNTNKEQESSESDAHTHTHAHTHAHTQQGGEERDTYTKRARDSEAEQVARQALSLLRRLTHDAPLSLSLSRTHTDGDALSLAQQALQKLSCIEAQLSQALSDSPSLSLAEEVLRKLLALCATANVSDAQVQSELARVRRETLSHTQAHAQAAAAAAEALARESLRKTAALQVLCRVRSGAASERERLALQVLRKTQQIAGEQTMLSVAAVSNTGSNADALSLAREILLKTNALIAV